MLNSHSKRCNIAILLEVIVVSKEQGVSPAVQLIELNIKSKSAQEKFLNELVHKEEGVGFVIHRKATKKKKKNGTQMSPIVVFKERIFLE